MDEILYILCIKNNEKTKNPHPYYEEFYVVCCSFNRDTIDNCIVEMNQRYGDFDMRITYSKVS